MMSTDNRPSIPGIVLNGVIIPQVDSPLVEGTHVEIRLEPESVSADLQSELAAWDSAGEEAWNLIDLWEAEES